MPTRPHHPDDLERSWRPPGLRAALARALTLTALLTAVAVPTVVAAGCGDPVENNDGSDVEDGDAPVTGPGTEDDDPGDDG